jgi:hypothetical protein
MSTDHIGERTAEGAGGTELKIAAATTSVRYYSVAPGYRLNVRSGPGTGYTLVRVLSEGAKIPIYCQRPGEFRAEQRDEFARRNRLTTCKARSVHDATIGNNWLRERGDGHQQQQCESCLHTL